MKSKIEQQGAVVVLIIGCLLLMAGHALARGATFGEQVGGIMIGFGALVIAGVLSKLWRGA